MGDGDDSAAADEEDDVKAAVKDKEEEEEDPLVEEVLSEIAEDEISEVDLIMEDISDEILDLQQSMNGSDADNPFRPEDLRCRIDASERMECTSRIYELGDTPEKWKQSKAYVNEQIRRLRAQLFELKVRR